MNCNIRPFFSSELLRDLFEETEAKCFQQINTYPPDYLLNSSTSDIVEHLYSTHSIEPLFLHFDKAEITESGETTKEVIDYGRLMHLNANYYVFSIPFEGDQRLFFRQPSTYTLSPPRAAINGSEYLLTFVDTTGSPELVRKQLDESIRDTTGYIETIKTDVNAWNNSLKDKIEGTIKQRKEKILRDRQIVDAIGIPVKRRNDFAKTYIADVPRRKVIVPAPSTPVTPFKPEPTLEMAIYEDILATISHMSLVIERNPFAFSQMKEEDLRTHFLVQLNALYEGKATGETFNYSGKTDILIREGDRNIFIAECKFWKGRESLINAIDQILGYISWRDTKTAILFFNRNKDLSKVIEQIPVTVASHPCYKRQIDYASETGWRFSLSNSSDKSREILLTVLIFDLPTKES